MIDNNDIGVTSEFMAFLISDIISQYKNFDNAHKENHVKDVIKFSLEIISNEDLTYDREEVNISKVAFIASCFHDIGLSVERDNHEQHSIKIFNEYYKTNHLFKMNIKPFEKDEILKGIEEHRSSYKGTKSMIGRIISDADGYTSFKTNYSPIKRIVLFNLGKSKEDIKLLTKEHFNNKYSDNGYNKFYYDYTKMIFNPKLEFNRDLFKNDSKFDVVFNTIYKEIINERVLVNGISK